MRNPATRLIAIIFPAMIALPATGLAQSETPPDGSKIYMYNCMACHQSKGQGMPNMAPALKDHAILAGDPAVLIQILLRGPAAVLPKDRPSFGASTMDSYYYKLNDEEMAAVLTYVRKTFGKDVKSPDVDAKAVAAARAALDKENSGN
jgi:mono/diheme cytochrome c family protein